MELNIDKLDFEKGGGLIPGIIQDARSREVLMLGYFNREALEKSIREQRVTFYSRSKKRLWTKGESSGNYLELKAIRMDCDQDALLVAVIPLGPVCHRGSNSCFREVDSRAGFFRILENIVKQRSEEPVGEQSYTRYLLEKGPKKIGQKVGEEGVEVALEAANGDKSDLINESADLLYHLLVLWRARDIRFAEVEKTLAERHN
ncbi:MAG: bifunctional phosphoribosyl-AMP cyclohydrolase/phosphoribosyl-ATP diphosphatase HisIE [Bacteroidetes bacterium]|nr:bifunctional phosphoribosyl-AMP cyclohydrolase/phosphoribosyl-ATP diphosphatase HisIE [Bacteroidota bacterium]